MQGAGNRWSIGGSIVTALREGGPEPSPFSKVDHDALTISYTKPHPFATTLTDRHCGAAIVETRELRISVQHVDAIWSPRKPLRRNLMHRYTKNCPASQRATRSASRSTETTSAALLRRWTSSRLAVATSALHRMGHAPRACEPSAVCCRRAFREHSRGVTYSASLSTRCNRPMCPIERP